MTILLFNYVIVTAIYCNSEILPKHLPTSNKVQLLTSSRIRTHPDVGVSHLHVQDILPDGHVVSGQDHPARVDLHHAILLLEHPIQQITCLGIQLRKSQHWFRFHFQRKSLLFAQDFSWDVQCVPSTEVLWLRGASLHRVSLARCRKPTTFYK